MRTKGVAPGNNVGLHDINANVLARIQLLTNQFWMVTHQNYSGENKDEIIGQYNNLKEIIGTLLGQEISTNHNQDATLFNKRIFEANLSDGQKILLQLAVAIHAQGGKLKEAIILLDEPENHLHPSAAIEVIGKIIHEIPEGQIWISTHNISIIAHFNQSATNPITFHVIQNVVIY